MTATVTRSPIEALTEGMSERTAELVRIAIRRAIRNGQERDRLLYEEHPPIARRIEQLEHSHAPFVSDAGMFYEPLDTGNPRCCACEVEEEEQRILGRVQGCTERLGGQA